MGEDDDWVEVQTGWSHSCALKSDKSLWCWGDGGLGQIGVAENSSESVNIPEQVAGDFEWLDFNLGYYSSCGRDFDKNLYCWGGNGVGSLGTGDRVSYSIPTRTVFDNLLHDYVSGAGNMCVIKEDKTLWCWGHNTDGQLGNGTRDTVFEPQQVYY